MKHALNCAKVMMNTMMNTMRKISNEFSNGEQTMGAFFWDYSGYSYSVLGITDTRNFNFEKNAPSGTENYYYVCGLVGFPAKNFPKERAL